MMRGQKERATSATANSLPTLLVKTAPTPIGFQWHHRASDRALALHRCLADQYEGFG